MLPDFQDSRKRGQGSSQPGCQVNQPTHQQERQPARRRQPPSHLRFLVCQSSCRQHKIIVLWFFSNTALQVPNRPGDWLPANRKHSEVQVSNIHVTRPAWKPGCRPKLEVLGGD